MKQNEFLGHEIEKYEMGLFATMDKLLRQGLDQGDVKSMRLYFDIMSFSAKQMKRREDCYFNWSSRLVNL